MELTRKKYILGKPLNVNTVKTHLQFLVHATEFSAQRNVKVSGKQKILKIKTIQIGNPPTNENPSEVFVKKYAEI